jgi:hypothetical protein
MSVKLAGDMISIQNLLTPQIAIASYSQQQVFIVFTPV